MTVPRWAPPLIWAGVILILTSIPNPSVPRSLASMDKLVHFALYAGLGFLLARAVLHQGPVWRVLLVSIVIASGGAALDEWHQQFIPGRSMDIADWRADAAGAIVGACLAVIARRRPAFANQT